MYKHIGVPIDLAHRERLDKSLATASALGSAMEIPITLICVAGPAPGKAAHNPAELNRKVQALADELNKQSGVPVAAHVAVTGDPVADLNKTLNRIFHESGVDLVVMASHVPGFRDYIFHSNAGFLASHTDISVFVVRD